MSKSQLYLYFPDREALLHEVATSTCDGVLETQADVLSHFDSLTGIERYLTALVDLQLNLERPSGCPIASLAGQLAANDEQARLILAAGMDRWEAGLRTGLEAMTARGELKPDADPALLATQTLAVLQGGLLLARVRRDATQMRVAADTCSRSSARPCASSALDREPNPDADQHQAGEAVDHGLDARGG